MNALDPTSIAWILVRIVIFLATIIGFVFLFRLPKFRPYWLPALLASIVSLLFGGIIYGVFHIINHDEYGWTALALCPIASGFLFTTLLWVFQTRENKEAQWTLNRLAIEGITLPLFLSLAQGLFLLIAFLEGTICIIMALPFFMLFTVVGSLLAVTILWLRDWSQRQMLSCSLAIFMLTFIAQPIENQLLRKTEYFSETSTIEIQADPQTVFRYIPSYPQIPENESHPRWDELWFKLGVPAPQVSTVSCLGVNCERQCKFNQNINLHEKITIYEPGKRLRFLVTSIVGHQNIITGVDPHLLPGGVYFDNQQGEFRLTEIRPGVTRVEGTTWYKLSSSLNWYGRPYTDALLEAIHMRVLEQIKRVAEEDYDKHHPA